MEQSRSSCIKYSLGQRGRKREQTQGKRTEKLNCSNLKLGI